MSRSGGGSYRMHALERASDHAREEGDIVLALDAGLQAVAAEPLRESARIVV